MHLQSRSATDAESRTVSTVCRRDVPRVMSVRFRGELLDGRLNRHPGACSQCLDWDEE